MKSTANLATITLLFLFASSQATLRAADPAPPKAAAKERLSRALTLHASFDEGLDADFSRGDRTCYVRQGKELVSASPNDDVKIVPNGGRHGGALHFTRKSAFRPGYKGAGVVDYNEKSWSTSVSIYLRLDPDKDLEPGYCDPVQIIGDDVKKGFIFLEWSKDETPRFFRFAVRPLLERWNPENTPWDAIPAEKRPMVQVAGAPFSREKWTHVVFTLANINDKDNPPSGRLYLNGVLQGTIENWDLTLGWDPSAVMLTLGASYVGHMDDLAVFDRALTPAEVEFLSELENGARELYP